MQPVIYNVTTAVSHAISEAWMQWMLDVHIPEVLGTGCFYKHQFVKMLEVDETEGLTYAIQYYAENQSAYEDYVTNYAGFLRKKVTEKWGEQIYAFSSLMAVLQ